MIERRLNRHTKFMSITTIFGMVVMLLLLFASCGGDKTEVVAVAFNPDETYTMRTTDFVSLVSDSGITRYRVTGKEMLVFDKASEPYMYFPEGVYAEQFDSLFVAQASLKADTGYNWYNKKLWKAIGNVEIENLQGERFETDSIYWDEVKQKIYSDAFMRITRSDRIITGIGFESNQDMSEYRIFHPQGTFPVSEEAKNDSTSQATREPVNQSPEMPVIQHQRPQRRAVSGMDTLLIDTPPVDTIAVEIEEVPEL